MGFWPLKTLPLALTLTIIFGAQTHADDSNKISIFTEEFWPYNFEDMGEARGMSTEVVNAMLEHAGLEAQIEFYPWPRAYQYAQQKPDTLIYSIARIPEREALFYWIGTIAPYQTSLYKLRSRTDLDIESLADARTYRVGVSQQDVIYTYLKGKGFENLEVARADKIALNMLAFGRTDLVALDEAGLVSYAQAAQIEIEDIERVLRVDDLSGELYIAAHPNSDVKLVQKLKASLDALKQNGVYDAIRSRWFGEE